MYRSRTKSLLEFDGTADANQICNDNRADGYYERLNCYFIAR